MLMLIATRAAIFDGGSASPKINIASIATTTGISAYAIGTTLLMFIGNDTNLPNISIPKPFRMLPIMQIRSGHPIEGAAALLMPSSVIGSVPAAKIMATQPPLNPDILTATDMLPQKKATRPQ